jgi:hypothetical protein
MIFSRLSFWNKWFADKQVGGEYKHHTYGEKDSLPLDLVKFVSQSGVAKRALNKYQSFVEADGFVDINAAYFRVNKNQKADSLLRSICNQIAYYKGFALLVKRNVGGEIISTENITFYPIRKMENGYFVYDENVGQKVKKKGVEPIIYAPYRGLNPTPEQIQTDIEIAGRNGEIVYAFMPSEENPIYPIPDYYAGIDDLITSNELQQFDLETVINGFVVSAILTMIGDVDDEVKGSDGMTDMERLQSDLAEFTGQKKLANGRSQRNSLFVNFAPTKEQVPVLQTFDAKAMYEASTSKREFIERAVCRLFGVHPVLLGYSEAAVLGNDKALQNAAMELNKLVNPLQRLITDTMSSIYPTMNWTISEFKISTENVAATTVTD